MQLLVHQEVNLLVQNPGHGGVGGALSLHWLGINSTCNRVLLVGLSCQDTPYIMIGALSLHRLVISTDFNRLFLFSHQGNDLWELTIFILLLVLLV